MKIKKRAFIALVNSLDADITKLQEKEELMFQAYTWMMEKCAKMDLQWIVFEIKSSNLSKTTCENMLDYIENIT